MKTIITIFFFLIIFSTVNGQDVSDIRYINTNRLDSTFIGREVLFDFFNISFHGKTIDTIEINVDKRPIKFVEVRVDNGHFNLFSEQGFKSIETIDEQKMRISKFELDSITSTAFLVKIYIDYFDSRGNNITEKSKEIKYWFEKKDIIKVLVHAIH
jgi:hypothetical protein